MLEPDLRPTQTDIVKSLVSSPVHDNDGNCVYHMGFTLPFKNISFKGGYIDKAVFINQTHDALPKYEVIEIEKNTIGWGEEKEIGIKYLVKADPPTCAKLWRKESIKVLINFYDNKGKLIDKDINDIPFFFGIEWYTKGAKTNDAKLE